MPNNKYLRSCKRERELVNNARQEGSIAARTAGSHSPIDVFIWSPRDKILRLIQVKTHKGARTRIERDKRVYDNITVIESTVEWK